MGSRFALVFFITVAFGAGCGRSLKDRDGQASLGDTGLDGMTDRSDGGPSGDVVAEVGGSDLTADVADVARADRPDDAPPDTSAPSDTRLPETRQDLVEPPEVGQDLPADREQAETGQDLARDRDQPETGSDLAADRSRDGDSCETASSWNVQHCGTCDHDCTKLPHVNTSIESLSCQNGVCRADICELGYANCSTSTQGDRACQTDLWNDVNNCGACGMKCGQAGGTGVCHRGACVGECPAERGDCTDDFGCETHLSTPDHCGACGQPACRMANVIAPCRQPGAAQCNDGFCAPNYGNCDRTSGDCEAPYGSSTGTCLPTYKGTVWLPTGRGGITAARADGARFIGGQFQDTTDFDFTAGGDVINPPEAAGSPYVTMIKADGGYGWTRTFRTTGYVNAVAAAGDGSVVVAGTYQDGIVLDTAGGGSYVSTPTKSVFVVKLASNGSFVWGVVLEVPPTGGWATMGSGALGVAPDGSIYVGGVFALQVDFDPGPGTADRIGGDYIQGAPFLLKLDKDGRFRWVDTWDVSPSGCLIYPGRFAVTATGAIWASGSYYDACDFDPGATTDIRRTGGGYLLTLDAMGRYGGAWSISSDITDVTTDSQGAVYATGSYRGTVDFDPGSAEVVRTSTDYPSSYVFKLGPGGVFQWVITPTRFSANAIALGGDGGVLVAGLFGADGIGGAGVIEIFPDQSRGWSVGFGNAYVRVTGLTSTANGFFVGGYAYNSFDIVDMDPGVGVDPVPGGGDGNPFISEYGY